MPLKRTAALAVSSLIVLGGGATALAATGTFTSGASDAVNATPMVASDAAALPDLSGLPSFDGVGDLLGAITVDPETGAIEGPGFSLQPPVTSPDGSATFSGRGPDGQSHSATITPGADGGRPTITIDGHDLGSMLDQFLGQHPELQAPNPATIPSIPPISVPPQFQQFLDQARDAIGGALGGSMPQWPQMPRA